MTSASPKLTGSLASDLLVKTTTQKQTFRRGSGETQLDALAQPWAPGNRHSSQLHHCPHGETAHTSPIHAWQSANVTLGKWKPESPPNRIFQKENEWNVEGTCYSNQFSNCLQVEPLVGMVLLPPHATGPSCRGPAPALTTVLRNKFASCLAV